MKKFKEIINRLKIKAKNLKKDILALLLAYRRPEVPWYAKALAIIVVGYALSPIDLIPDFIPILGFLDDVILLPLGISVLVKLIPPSILDECRKEVLVIFKDGRPKSWRAAGVIIGIWLLVALYIVSRLF